MARNMKNPGGDRLDLSFLEEEEVSRILEVLERDEQLRRTEQERLSKLKSWKRDVKWLHAVSGEWFEEIQKKKFKDDPDVRSLVRPPLTHRLKKKTPKGETESSRMTTSRNFQPQKNSGPSFLGLRSPLSSFFSFRKSAKQNIKPPPPQERQSIFSVSAQISPNTGVKKKFEIYNSARSVKQIASFFEAHQNRIRENATTKGTTQIEKEVFQVLGDLDQKLAQEQSQKQTLRTSRLGSYKYGRDYSKEDSLHNTSEPKKVYNSLPSHDGRNKVSLEGTHTTYGTYQPRKFYDMYSNRQRPAPHSEISNRKSSSHFSSVSSTSPCSSPNSGSFSSSSLQQLSSPSINLERTRLHKSRRTPVTSIKWNYGKSEETSRPFRTQSAWDLTNIGNSNHQNRLFDVYKYKNTPREPSSTSSVFTNMNNVRNIMDIGSSEYYKTDYPGLSHGVQCPTRHCEEEDKGSSFNDCEINKSPNENVGVGSDKETEPMELDSELSGQLNTSSEENYIMCRTETSRDLGNLNLQTERLSTKADVILELDHELGKNETTESHDEDVPVNCPPTSQTVNLNDPIKVSSTHTSEPELMDVDSPNGFLHYTNTTSSTSIDLGTSTQEDQYPQKTERPGLPLSDRHPSLDGNIQASAFEPRISYKMDLPSFTHVKSSKISDGENITSYKRSSLYSNAADTGGRFAWMNMRRGSSDNRSEGFFSDALKVQKRNASSLPDLIDQDTDILGNDPDVALLENSSENVVVYDANTDAQAEPSSGTADDLDNSKNVQSCVQKIVHEPKYFGLRTSQYLHKTHKPYDSVLDGTFKNVDQKSTYPTMPYWTDSLIEKSNHKEGFLSDNLKYKKRNASSLPDVLDQESDIFDNDPEMLSPKTSCQLDEYYHSPSVLETISSSISKDSKEIYNSTRYAQPWEQGSTLQPKRSNLSTWRSLQKLSTFSSGSETACTVISVEQTAESEVVYEAETMTESDRKVRNWLHSAENPQFSHVTAKFKGSQYNGQCGSDSNNNTRPIKGVQASELFNKDDGSSNESGYVHQRQYRPETEQVIGPKHDLFSRPKPSRLYRQDVVSPTDQDNADCDMYVEARSDMKRNLNQTFIEQLDHKVNNKLEEPKVRNSSGILVGQNVMDNSEDSNFNKSITYLPTTESTSTNLLKKHLLVTPETYKPNVHISVISGSERNHSTSCEDIQTTTSLETENLNNLDCEDKVSQESLPLHKKYTCQRIIENTEIYESLTDSVYPEVDTIEYRKVVSIYYSLPRKFSRRISDLSKNNIKNIDKTLAQNRAPSSLLDRLSKGQEEKVESYLQNVTKTAPCIMETVDNEEIKSVNDIPCQTHHLDFHIIPLQTNLVQNRSRPNSEEETEDLVNKFSSLHIYENENHYPLKEDPKNKNDYSPSRSSPKSSPYPNPYYYTLPSRKSSLQDLEWNVLEKDVAMARDRFNIYSRSRTMEPSPPELQDVFTSPTFSYDLNFSPTHDFMHIQESNKRDYNINNSFASDGGLYKKNSLDEYLSIREDLPSIYKAKSSKDLSEHKSYKAEDLSPRGEYNTSPPSFYNFPNFGKGNNVVNQPRRSYCSEFVQKKMKPINAKKFSFSFDHSGKEKVSPRHTGSYGDTVRISDGDSPPKFYSPNDNYPSYVDKHFRLESRKDYQNDPYSNLYRSKSMKFLNKESQENFMDYKRNSDGSFSSKSYGGTLRNKSPSGDNWNRRFSADILDENDNLPISEGTYERKPACTSKSVDYGIFGKEQQEAILNNVKRSLTEGRLWRPSFLRNPGALRTEEFCSAQEVNPVGRSPDDLSPKGPNVKESLQIYEDEPVVSTDTDTDTTTEDEYYLDGNEKESEL